MIKHTYFNPSKMLDEFLSFFLLILARSNYDHYARECNFGILKKKTTTIYKTSIGPSWHGPSFASWAELAWADFHVGRVCMGRVGFGPSCPAP